MAKLKPYLVTFAALSCFGAGLLLNDHPGDPDVLFPAGKRMGVFLVFAGFAILSCEWGRLLCALLKIDRWVYAPVLGSAFLGLLMTALGSAGWIGIGSSTLDWFLFFLVLPLGLYRPGPVPSLTGPALDKQSWFFLLLAAAMIFAFGIEASVPLGFPDPLDYHLMASRLWFDSGKIQFFPEHPLLYHAAYWELFAAWSNVFLAGPPGRGLIEAQLFTQWIHVLFGLGGSMLMLFQLFDSRNRDRSETATGAFFGICALSTLSLACTAKSDWGIIAWICGGFALIRSATCSRQRWAGGALIGVGAATKWTTLYFVLPAAAFFGDAASAAAAIALCVPILLRNFIATRNPVFPTMGAVFPSPVLSQPLQQFFGNFATRDFSVHAVVARLYRVSLDLSRSAPCALGVLAAPIAWKLLRKDRELKFWFAVIGIDAALLALTTDASYYDFWRVLGPAPIIAGALGGLVFMKAISRFTRSGLRGAALLLALVALAWTLRSNEVFSGMARIFENPTETIRAHLAGDAKAWLRLHAAPGDLVFSGGDTQFYYISNLKTDCLNEDAEIDRSLSSVHGARGIVNELRRRNGRYLLDTWRFGRPMPWGRSMARLYPALDTHPEALVFQGKSARLYDLIRLESSLKQDSRTFLDQDPQLQEVIAP